MINERFIWALELLNIKEHDEVLEIGCGAGIAAELIAQHLGVGFVTAIDKSAAMIKNAVRRNEPFIEKGKASFFAIELSEMNYRSRKYDKIFAFNVNIFWKGSSETYKIVRSMLKDDGLLYVFHQPPVDNTYAIVQKSKLILQKNAFEVVEVVFKELKPTTASCIIARPL